MAYSDMDHELYIFHRPIPRHKCPNVQIIPVTKWMSTSRIVFNVKMVGHAKTRQMDIHALVSRDGLYAFIFIILAHRTSPFIWTRTYKIVIMDENMAVVFARIRNRSSHLIIRDVTQRSLPPSGKTVLTLTTVQRNVVTF
jgi:hypothetical protein